VLDFGAAGFVLSDEGAVDEGAPFLTVVDVAFLLEDADSGQDGVVGQIFAVGYGCYEVVDGGLAATPEDLHEPELGLG